MFDSLLATARGAVEKGREFAWADFSSFVLAVIEAFRAIINWFKAL